MFNISQRRGENKPVCKHLISSSGSFRRQAQMQTGWWLVPVIQGHWKGWLRVFFCSPLNGIFLCSQIYMRNLHIKSHRRAGFSFKYEARVLSTQRNDKRMNGRTDGQHVVNGVWNRLSSLNGNRLTCSGDLEWGKKSEYPACVCSCCCCCCQKWDLNDKSTLLIPLPLLLLLPVR